MKRIGDYSIRLTPVLAVAEETIAFPKIRPCINKGKVCVYYSVVFRLVQLHTPEQDISFV